MYGNMAGFVLKRGEDNMGEYTKISWADHSFNPWIGCAKVSAGCINCYAERDMDLRFGKVKWGPRGTRVLTKTANWNKPRKWNERAQENGHIETVFCASLADVFEDWQGNHLQPHQMDDWREELFHMMVETPWLVWLVLTKRPENVMYMIPPVWRDSWPPNVLVGFSAEDQGNYDFRIREARKIPTPILWLSAEPLLGPINLYHGHEMDVDWVITGGESGPSARPTHSRWVSNIRDVCAANDVPFYHKQWGEWAHSAQYAVMNDSGRVWKDTHTWPDGSGSWRVGRKEAGRLLFGRMHDEFPPYLYEYEESLQDA